MDIGITAFLTDRAMAPALVAREVEERGFSSLYLPEHTHLPVCADRPPSLVEGVSMDDYRRSLDPLVALAQAGAVTSRIRLGTGVLLVAQHDPVVLAKQLATLDLLSAGRVVLGIGYGWNEAEAADHGIDFALRRDIAHEKLQCMYAIWSSERPEFHGRHVELPPCWSWPKPIQQPRITTLIGGGAGPKLFGAIAQHADGWMPIGGSGLRSAMARLHEAWDQAGRHDGAPRVITFGTIPSRPKLDYYAELGVDEVVLRVPSGPSSEMLAVLDEYSTYLNH